MKRQQKETIVEEIRKDITGRTSIILADFTGIDVKEMTDLRRSLRDSETSFRVVKNTLLRRAAVETSLEGLAAGLEGPTALVMSDDVVPGAKALVDFAKKSQKPQIKAALIEGSIIEPDEVKRIASLPPRPVLLGQLVGGLSSPISMMMNVMQGVVVQFLLTLNAVKEAKDKEA